MSILDRLESFKLETKDHPDINYLKNSTLGSVVNRGLAELYKVQPKNPVTFLATWLLNESRSSQIRTSIEESNKKRDALKVEYQEMKHKRDLEQAENTKTLEAEEAKKRNFIESIKTCNDFDANLDSISESLKGHINATGVYISEFDKKRRQPLLEEDEFAHILPIDVIRYIHFCNDHRFLKDKCLEPEIGITYNLYKPKEEEAGGENKDNNENKEAEANPEAVEGEEQQTPKETVPNHVLVDEVVRNKGVKFFREPRLGCYLAIDIAYESSKNVKALNSAIECYEDYVTRKAAQQERLKEFETQRAQARAEAEKNQDPEENVEENPVNLEEENTFNETEEREQEFDKVERRLIISLDTLGQDRVFSEEETKYVFEAAKILKDSLQNLERGLLLKDRDLRIDMIKLENEWNAQNSQDKIESNEEKYIKEYFAAERFVENPITDETVKAIESEYARSRYIVDSLLNDETLFKVLTLFSELEIVEHERVFQQTLYFAGLTSEQINEEGTNRLDWKKARSHWNSGIFTFLNEYYPHGPKPAVMNNQPGNKILMFLEGVDKEALRKYSIALSRLHDFMLIILTIRKNDIIRRKGVRADQIEERNNLIGKKEEEEQRRERELADAKYIAENPENPEEAVEFNEEEFLEKWNEANPIKDIPEPIEYDVDEDFDVNA